MTHKVTKPIALDESFRTTEQNPQNIADVLANKLDAIKSAIENGGSGEMEAAFECHYNVTSATDIYNAMQDKKVPFFYNNGVVAQLWKVETNKYTFRTTSTRVVEGENILDIVDYIVNGSVWSTATKTISGGSSSQQAYLAKVESSVNFDTTGLSGMQSIISVNDVPSDGVYQLSIFMCITPKTASATKSDLVFQFTGTSGTGMPNTTFHAVVDDSQTFGQQLSFSTTLNLKAGTNSLKMACGGLNTEYLVFVDNLTVAQLVNGVYHNGDTFEEVNDLTEASDFNADDVLLVVSPNSKRKMLWQTLANKVLGFIKNLSTTITAFRTGDVIPVDGPSGTAKMPESVLTDGIIYEDTITSTKRISLRDNAGISYRFTNVSGANVVARLQDSNNADVVDFGELTEGDAVTYKVSDLSFASLLLYPRGECSVKVETLVSFNRLGERENDLEFVQNPTISTFNLSAGSFVFEIPYIVGTILRFVNDGAGEFDVYLMKSRSTSTSERASTVVTHLGAGKSVDYDVISSVKFSHVFVYVRTASTLKVEQRVSNVTLAENDKKLEKVLSKKTDARVIGLDTFSVDIEEGFFFNIGAIGSTFDYSASHTRENGWECLYTNEIYWNTEITLKCYGNNSVNVYAWLDADNKILEVGTQAGFQGTLKAPTGAKKFVYNNRKSASLGFIYKGVFNVEKDPFTIAHFNGSPFENFFAVANGVLNSQFRIDKILLSDPTTEKACHVSSFVKVGTEYYYAYYCNYITATENVSQQTARFGHCNLDGSGKNVVDVMSVGDTYNDENVVALSDIVVLKKNNDDEELVLCWTIATGADWASRKWRLVYATYNILTDTLSVVGDCGISYNGSAIAAFTCENVSSLGIGSCPNGTIQIMPKITGRLENGVYTYYTGLGVETYCAVIKSTNLHDWEIVARPIGMNCEYEPACYILNDSPNILHLFCRQSASEGSAVYAQYDIANNVWKNELYFQDTQSRPDMFEFDGGLYVIHAVPNRNHIVIEKIDVLHPWESTIHSDIYSEQSFYPFALVESDHIEISFTQDRKYIYLSNFSMYAISRESLNTKLLELLS